MKKIVSAIGSKTWDVIDEYENFDRDTLAKLSNDDTCGRDSSVAGWEQ